MTPSSTTNPTPPWHIASSSQVRAILAQAAASPSLPVRLGDVTLMPHQLDALCRVRRAMREFHGALLADEVGLGKTFVALALAREYDHVLVIAPAVLIPMWRNAIRRSDQHHVDLRSMHRYSAHDSSAVAAATSAPAQLVIIDEAHHLRTRTTNRYRAIASAVAGRDVLLLSATPLHNSDQDIRSLLALFVGTREDVLDPPLLAKLIIRQTAASSSASNTPTPSNDTAALSAPGAGGPQRTPPARQRHPPFRMPHDRVVLDAILALPAPLPARDGAVAGALIRIGLLRAWCSSSAALNHLLRRRVLRGEALREALLAGRHPTQAELRTWIVGDHEVQLAFPELLAAPVAESEPLLAVMHAHLRALQALLELPCIREGSDASRADMLRQVIAAHPDVPILAFSQFSQTVHALYRALSDIAGVGALTGMHARIASGRITRSDAISRFAPRAQGRPPPPPHQAIRLLIATDLLAEGVNLQDAGVVVHLDMPWTHALLQQRVGRIARIGATHTVVHVYQFAPYRSADRALRLTARLLAKATAGTQHIGRSKAEPAGAHRQSPAELATYIHTTLQSWRRSGTSPLDTSPLDRPPLATWAMDSAMDSAAGFAAATIPANMSGWLALVRDTGEPRHLPLSGVDSVGTVERRHAPIGNDESLELIAHIGRTGNAPHLLWRALRVSATSTFTERDHVEVTNPRAVARAHRALAVWIAERETARSLGASPASGARAQQRARLRLTEVVAALAPIQRSLNAAAIRQAEHVIERSVSAGAVVALDAWVGTAQATQRAPERWIAAWCRWPLLAQLAETSFESAHRALNPVDSAGSPAPSDRSPHWQLLALLLLRRRPKGVLP